MNTETIRIQHTSTVEPTGRLRQIAGSLDLDDPSTSTFSATVDIPPGLDQHGWNLGAVLGPSGSGKSSLIRHLWPNYVTHSPHWAADTAVADAFPPDMSASSIANLLTRMGLASVPTWVRPYHALSNGEQFRADMARLVADDSPITIVDEFTSLVDRTVARATAHTVGKSIRNQDKRFIAATCHYDVLDWLQPDWVVDMATGTFTWRSVQPRPQLDFRICAADRRAWTVFAPHHYLDTTLPSTCQGRWVGLVSDSPAAIIGVRKFPHPRSENLHMITRLVTLPDFQGFGIGLRLAEWVGQRYANQRQRVRIATSHPAFRATLAQSPRWRRDSKNQTLQPGKTARVATKSAGHWRRLKLATFEYQPPAT